jgi:uncharacterized protein (TIGR02231 family)
MIMKKLMKLQINYIIFIVAFLSCHINTIAQNETVHNVASEIKSVVIYLDGAEITQSKAIKLSQGRNIVNFEGLSPNMDAKTIRVSVPPEAENNISILAISTKIDYLNKVEEQPRIKKVRDSIEQVLRRMKEIDDDIDAYRIEKETLLKNQSIGGTDKGLTVAELKLAIEYFRSRIKEINNLVSQIEYEKNKLNESSERLKNQLIELNAEISYQRSQISILLSADVAVNTIIELKYLVSDAGWSPTYDIKATEIDKPVQLIYRAKVFNNTKINWENIDIRLSTADPNQTIAKPELPPWYLNYNLKYGNLNNYFRKGAGYMQNAPVQMDSGKGRFDQQEMSTDEVVQEGNLYKEIEVSDFIAEFDIKTKYTIPSDNKPYLVDVSRFELPAKYKYFCIPKLDRDAFLLAKIIGWEDLNLVEGPANVYFAGTFVGQSYINTRNVKDTLDLSLGRDKKVLVTRSKVKDYSSTKFIGTKRKESFAFEMVVKNNRKVPIEIEILDQLPVSQDSEIEVEKLEISDAVHDDLSGKLTWKFMLSPGDTKKLKLAFSIKYPKNREIEVEQTQKRAMRMY